MSLSKSKKRAQNGASFWIENAPQTLNWPEVLRNAPALLLPLNGMTYLL